MDWKLNIRTNGLHSFKVEGAFLKIMWRFQEILKDGKGRTFEKVEWRGHSNHHTGETDWDWMKRTMGFNSWHPKCLSKKNEIQMGLDQLVSVCLISPWIKSLPCHLPQKCLCGCKIKLTSSCEWDSYSSSASFHSAPSCPAFSATAPPFTKQGCGGGRGEQKAEKNMAKKRKL